jgi:glucokinase
MSEQCPALGQPALGIDIGGTRIKAALVTANGEVLERRLQPSADDSQRLVAIVCELAKEFTPCALGVSAPGLAAPDNRTIAWMRGRMQAVEGLDWRRALERDVWVLNDAHGATVGEAWIGAAAGAQHALLLTLGTGVGGGVIVHGQLLQGALGRAGHLGHITLNESGPVDIVGTPGSLEDAIGNHNIAERTNGRFHSTADLLAAVSRGDDVAVAAWRLSVQSLAVGIASLLNVFDPELVVIGGGIAECGVALFDPLRTELDRLEWRPTGHATPIVPAALGEFAGAIGAARFAMLKSQQD